jgi:hypothetical protein
MSRQSALYGNRLVLDGLSDVFEQPRHRAFEHFPIVGIARSESTASDFNRIGQIVGHSSASKSRAMAFRSAWKV